MSYPKWTGSPEERIIHGKKYAKEAGLKANKSGQVVEELVICELTKLAAERTDHDLRFSRGWIVEDYGKDNTPGASWQEANKVETGPSPRLDIICYHGNVARKYHSNIPHTLVPQSNVYAFIEVKKYLSPGRLHEGSHGNPVNNQLDRQRKHAESLGLSIPQVLLGIEYSESSEQRIREEAHADTVGLISCLTDMPSVADMANEGELENVLDALTPFPVKK
jgi:hypothetical protein